MQSSLPVTRNPGSANNRGWLAVSGQDINHTEIEKYMDTGTQGNSVS